MESFFFCEKYLAKHTYIYTYNIQSYRHTTFRALYNCFTSRLLVITFFEVSAPHDYRTYNFPIIFVFMSNCFVGSACYNMKYKHTYEYMLTHAYIYVLIIFCCNTYNHTATIGNEMYMHQNKCKMYNAWVAYKHTCVVVVVVVVVVEKQQPAATTMTTNITILQHKHNFEQQENFEVKYKILMR